MTRLRCIAGAVVIGLLLIALSVPFGMAMEWLRDYSIVGWPERVTWDRSLAFGGCLLCLWGMVLSPIAGIVYPIFLIRWNWPRSNAGAGRR